jgi:SAM-dependent methyltransferase
MIQRNCPICNTDAAKAKLFLKESIQEDRLNSFSFASRKIPEFMNYQLVRCPQCDLIYVDHPPKNSELARQYHVSNFDSSEEANDAANSYANMISGVLNHLTTKDAALEIGTGTGIFLEYLKGQGFTNLQGVEPSSAAIAAAPEHRQKWIREAIFEESDFVENSFDLICCFMTLEHVGDPNQIVGAASRLLKPGGALVLVTHDHRSWVNRLLGRRSPIIDIEHMQLFSRKSIEELFIRNHFENIQIESFFNCYTLRYWVRLLPLNLEFKEKLTNILNSLGLADRKIRFNVGNIFSVAYRSFN